MPCELRFKGSSQDVVKLRKLLTPAGSEANASVKDTPVEPFMVEQPRKKARYDPDITVVEDVVLSSENVPAPWLSLKQVSLTIADKEIIVEGKQLTDKHMNYA